ncbi:hypothetical protein KIPB_011680, partial [Kipferlia bialata]
GFGSDDDFSSELGDIGDYDQSEGEDVMDLEERGEDYLPLLRECLMSREWLEENKATWYIREVMAYFWVLASIDSGKGTVMYPCKVLKPSETDDISEGCKAMSPLGAIYIPYQYIAGEWDTPKGGDFRLRLSMPLYNTYTAAVQGAQEDIRTTLSYVLRTSELRKDKEWVKAMREWVKAMRGTG